MRRLLAVVIGCFLITGCSDDSSTTVVTGQSAVKVDTSDVSTKPDLGDSLLVIKKEEAATVSSVRYILTVRYSNGKESSGQVSRDLYQSVRVGDKLANNSNNGMLILGALAAALLISTTME